MKHFEKVVERDPLKLGQYDGTSGAKSSRTMYPILALSIIFLVASIGFFIFGALFDSSDSQVTPV